MIFQLGDLDGSPYLLLDEDGIDYLEAGLRHLREAEPGQTITAPSFVTDDGMPVGVAEFELRRA